jgi:hypothetical protein
VKRRNFGTFATRAQLKSTSAKYIVSSGIKSAVPAK